MAVMEVTSPAFKGEFHRHSSPARLILTSTGATPGAADQAQLVEFLSRIVQLKVPFVSVYDLRVLGMPSPSLLKGLGEWCKQHEKDFASVQIAIAIILKNNLWSGAIKKMIGLVTVICPPVCPLQIGYSLEGAESFCSQHCPVLVDEVKRFTSRFPSVESTGCEDEARRPRCIELLPEFRTNVSDVSSVSTEASLDMVQSQFQCGEADLSPKFVDSLPFLDFAVDRYVSAKLTDSDSGTFVDFTNFDIHVAQMCGSGKLHLGNEDQFLPQLVVTI